MSQAQQYIDLMSGIIDRTDHAAVASKLKAAGIVLTRSAIQPRSDITIHRFADNSHAAGNGSDFWVCRSLQNADKL